MKDEHKTKEQLINELVEMRQRVAELEAADTARKGAEETLRTMVLVDELTGLYNRRGFLTLSRQQLKMADMTKRGALLLFADFDHLKRINDALGHPEGDMALIEVANVLKETFRESDIIARIGGDEFAILAIGARHDTAEILTTHLQENLEARNARGGRRYKVSLCVGVARYDPEHPCSIDELLAQADKSMYEQKEGNQKRLSSRGLAAPVPANARYTDQRYSGYER